MRVTVALISLVAAYLVKAQKEEVSEVAPYDVVKEGEGYEERSYPASRWVCHEGSSPRPSMSKMQMSFFPLFNYITGNNEQKTNIPMTAPVTMKMTEAAGEWKSQMCFYLPEAHQANPPTPSDPKVYIEDRPAMKVFGIQKGGFMTTLGDWDYVATQLKEALQGKEPAADFTNFYMAGYDSPMKFLNRRNEVWFMKKE